MMNNATSLAVKMMARTAKTYKGPDGEEVIAAAICEKYFKMEDALQVAQAKLISGSWVASREGYRDTAGAIDDAYRITQEALAFDPLHDDQ